MNERVRVGTRRSQLARTQTDWVIARLTRAEPSWTFEPVPIDTSGDRDQSSGSSPDFTDAIDRALRRGTVDMAVHSAKDLPVVLDSDFDLVACPPRVDPRDCLVVASQVPSRPLPRGLRIGSSSLRRRAQLLRWRPDLDVVDIRGNVDSRIGLVRSGELGAVILAVAGIHRLGRSEEIDRVLPSSKFLPAPAQGALAVVIRADDTPLASVAKRINHLPTDLCVTAERSFAAALGGDCRVPLGALARCSDKKITLTGEVLAPNGSRHLRQSRTGHRSEAREIGSRLGTELLHAGALTILSSTGG